LPEEQIVNISQLSDISLHGKRKGVTRSLTCCAREIEREGKIEREREKERERDRSFFTV
jgi:hypothetical protein